MFVVAFFAAVVSHPFVNLSRSLPNPPNPNRNRWQVNLRELRKIAVVKGLGTNALRARAWPLLLGARAGAGDLVVLQRLSSSEDASEETGQRREQPPLHRDSAVVYVDVERSLWAFTRGWSEGARASARAALRRVINAAVSEASRELLGGTGEGEGEERGERGERGERERGGEREGREEESTVAERMEGGEGEASAAGLRHRRRRREGELPSPSPSSKEAKSSSGEGSAGNGPFSSRPPPPPPPSPASTVHYYQGLHDVASVLLLVTGSEVAAFRLLRRLAACQLRDFTRQTLDAALEACDLLPRIVAKADPQLGRALDCSKNPGAPPSHYALPWLLTWFAHSASSSSGVAGARSSDGKSRNGGSTGAGAGAAEAEAAAASNEDTLNSAARLFDLFAASHPFMPLYVAAAAIVADKKRILEALAEGDPAESHAALSRTRVFGVGERRVGELAAEATRLCKRHPPGELSREAQRQGRAAASARSSTAALARLGADGSWVVEDRIAAAGGGGGGGGGVRSGKGGKRGKGSGGGGTLLLLKQLRSQQKARGVAAVALAAGVAALALLAGGPPLFAGGRG